ncbi:hypothetical protein ACWGPW_24580 [Paenibacillus chitinolyticus]
MNVTQELKVLRLGQPPEMRFKTGDKETPVFVLRVLTEAEGLEAIINTQKYLEETPLPPQLYEHILDTERIAIAIKYPDGKRYFSNGSEMRDKFAEDQVGALLGAYKGLLIHYKTLDVISDESLKTLIDGVAAGKLLESI